MHCFPADNVYRSKFNLSCAREVDTKTGLISYAFNWTLGPSTLPYDLVEALEFLNLDLDEVTIPVKGEPMRIDGYALSRFGRMEDTFNRSVPAVIMFEQNVSGSLCFGGVEPRTSPDMTQFQIEFEVSESTGKRVHM